MIVANTRKEVAQALEGKRIGFVPTMGALHDGHISLVTESRSRGLFTVVSIFVNPTQFNNTDDLVKYPKDTQSDLEKLKNASCDVVFLPDSGEIYIPGADQQPYLHDFGPLEHTLEGHFRPGHFKGVGQVVHILFEIIRPEMAFFGEKDFQQLEVIRQLVSLMKTDIEIVAVPTVREPGGLAMSSRNRRLTGAQRQEANILYRALTFARQHIRSHPFEEIEKEVKEMVNKVKGMRLEYFEIIDERTFGKAGSYMPDRPLRAVIAAYMGDVRLIDNMGLV